MTFSCSSEWNVFLWFHLRWFYIISPKRMVLDKGWKLKFLSGLLFITMREPPVKKAWFPSFSSILVVQDKELSISKSSFPRGILSVTWIALELTPLQMTDSYGLTAVFCTGSLSSAPFCSLRHSIKDGKRSEASLPRLLGSGLFFLFGIVS